MRKIVLALFLAFLATAVLAGPAAAMEGFDLGDMPPLPPPLLDEPAPSLAPPGSGPLSPLMQSGSTSAGLAPLAPSGASAAGSGGMDFTPMPPAPPPITPAPPPIAPPPGMGSASGSLTPPGQGASSLPGAIGIPPLPSQPQDAVAAPQVVLNEVPRAGRIEGGRVNVRAGPNTQYESIAVLTSGTPVTVMAKHGDWLKIVFPSDQLASIHKRNVDADISGEIPEAGLPGVVNADNADVHAFYWDKSTVVGKLNKGDPVVIKQERGQWYRIAAPESARAFVFANYVRTDGEVVADAAPAPVNPSVDLSLDGSSSGKPGERKLSEADRKVAEIKSSYYKRLQEKFEADRETEEREAEERAKALFEQRKLQATQLENALKDLDSRLAAIDQERMQRVTYFNQETQAANTPIVGVGAASWAPPDPAGGGYTGWVENIGRVGGAPSPYRLTKGGEIRFYLRSDRENLDEYTNRRVWLNGQIEPAGGASAGVLNVDQIRILTEMEIAAGMSQSGPMVQQYGQPYGQPYGDPSQMYGQQAPAGPAPGFDPYSAGSYTQMNSTGMVDTFAAGDYGSGGYSSGSYGAATTTTTDVMNAYGTPGVVGGDPYATGGAYYSGDSAGTADLAIPVPQGGFVSTPDYGAGSYGNTYMPQAGVPAGGLIPTDPSQLPDVVGASTNYYGGPTIAPGESLGTTVGEVETDIWEKPNIQEIAP